MSITNIRSAIEGTIGFLAQHPEKARQHDKPATAMLERGLRCKVEATGGYQVVTDMPKAVGGEEAAPTPGWLMRAAYAACDATMIAIRAAQEGVSLTRLEVTVDSETDNRGLLGMDESVSPGPLQVNMRVRIAAPDVPPDKLREIVAWAERHSPVGNALGSAVPSSTEVEIV